jgi:hypothetical protein
MEEIGKADPAQKFSADADPVADDDDLFYGAAFASAQTNMPPETSMR